MCMMKSQVESTLLKEFGKKEGARLWDQYRDSFSTNYYEECTLTQLVDDLIRIEKLSEKNSLDILIYQTDTLRLRVYQFGKLIPLSDLLPILENMNLRTLEEHPYQITPKNNAMININDFSVVYQNPNLFDLKKVKDLFDDAFKQICNGSIENDGFNKLVLGAELTAREIIILRAYAKYLRQTGFIFSQSSIEEALAAHVDIARLLVNFFIVKFSLQRKKSESIDVIETTILKLLESVTSLDEDRILRRFLLLMKATLRTNYFQLISDHQSKSYLSFKFLSSAVPELPLPHPLYEISVYSPQFEGIHLRHAKVARGGIRWSDRREDFRTEILSLMKAQVVKKFYYCSFRRERRFCFKKCNE